MWGCLCDAWHLGSHHMLMRNITLMETCQKWQSRKMEDPGSYDLLLGGIIKPIWVGFSATCSQEAAQLTPHAGTPGPYSSCPGPFSSVSFPFSSGKAGVASACCSEAWEHEGGCRQLIWLGEGLGFILSPRIPVNVKIRATPRPDLWLQWLDSSFCPTRHSQEASESPFSMPPCWIWILVVQFWLNAASVNVQEILI